MTGVTGSDIRPPRSGRLLVSFQAPAGINAWPAVAGDRIIWAAGVGDTPQLLALEPRADLPGVP